MKITFRRIISRGTFIPEIDGLRFIAIMSVLLYHIQVFLIEKDTHSYDREQDWGILYEFLRVGDLGVPLFFVISGFILARPFAEMHLSGGRPIGLRDYFLRRLTRLEPPYIVVMTGLLLGAVYVAGTLSWSEGIISYLASISYTHNFWYGEGTLPLINPVAWSLEIEVQFYILMPVLAMLFTIPAKGLRRIGLMILILIGVIWSQVESLGFVSVLDYSHYVLLGILLADIYVSGDRWVLDRKMIYILSLCSFVSIWAIEMHQADGILRSIFMDLLQLTSIGLFYYLVLMHQSVRVLTHPVVTGIGGMCYSIYLLHYALISLVGNPLLRYQFSNDEIYNTLIYGAILLLVVLVISSAFYLLIERPCMQRRWYRRWFGKS